MDRDDQKEARKQRNDGGDKDRNDGDRQPRGGSGRGPSVDEILGRDLVANSSQSGAKLRELLNSTILVRCTDSGKRFMIDWSQPELSSKSVGSDSTAECTVSLSEENLKRIALGDLNPQIAMLSDKVKVEGRKGVAMYLFNLIAPRQGM